MSLLFRLRIHHHALEGPVVHISSYLSYPESRPGHVPWNMCYKYLVFLKSDHHSSYLITSIWSENYHSSGVPGIYLDCWDMMPNRTGLTGRIMMCFFFFPGIDPQYMMYQHHPLF